MAISITGDLSLGSSAITDCSTTSGVVVGMFVDHEHVPAGTVVTIIDTPTLTITMSAPATEAADDETIEFVSSFACSVSATVVVTAPALILDAALETDTITDARTAVTATGAMADPANERFACGAATSVTVDDADLQTGRGEILAGAGNVSVVVTADLLDGRNQLIETAAAVISVTVTADVTDGMPRLEARSATSVEGEADLEIVGRTLFDAIDLYVDVITRNLVIFKDGNAAAIYRKLLVKRNDRPLVRVRFIKYDAIFDMPDTTIVRLGAKPKGQYGDPMVFQTADMTRYLDEDRLPYYEDQLDLTLASVSAQFLNDSYQKADCVGEIEVSTPSLGTVASTQEFAVEIWNDVIRGVGWTLYGTASMSVSVAADLDAGTP